MKYLIVSEGIDESSLAYSYKRALERKGEIVTYFNINTSVSKSHPIPFLPVLINNFIFGHFEPKTTIQKVNIELTKHVLINKIDVLFCFTNTLINPSTMVYLRSLGKKIVLIYPDAIINMQQRNSACVSYYDNIYSYSQLGVKSFTLLGAENVFWCPLAGDETIHEIKPKTNNKFLYDISFIGNHRPEREEVLHFIINKFPNLKIKINGSWKKAKSKKLKSIAENRQIYGTDYARFINNSFISLNIIDHSNFPAANMRFFEIPISGGFQISSACPEMENILIEGKHLLYYNDLEELIKKIEYCFSNKEKIQEMRNACHELVLKDHLYSNRLEMILKSI
jgi:spore maturation protein CgeB